MWIELSVRLVPRHNKVGFDTANRGPGSQYTAIGIQVSGSPLTAATADFQQLRHAAVAVNVRAAIAVHFQGQAMHRVAAAAKTVNGAVAMLDDLADLGAAFLRLKLIKPSTAKLSSRLPSVK